MINIFITLTTPVEIRPPAPTGVQDEPPTLANLGSGRSNIRKKTFHVLLIFDSAQHGIIANQDLFLLNHVFSTFDLEFVRDSTAGDHFKVPDDFTLVNDPVVIDSPDLSQAKIFDAIDDMSDRVKPGDVVFTWVETEGTVVNGKRMLEINAAGEQINRDELLKKLRFEDDQHRQKPTLTILITDACSVREPAPVAYKTYDTGRDITIWKSLYFGHAGVVDISSSHILEKAFVREGESIFARAFRNAFDSFKNPKEIYDADQDGFIDWETEFFPRMQKQARLRAEAFGLQQEPELLGTTQVWRIPLKDE